MSDPLTDILRAADPAGPAVAPDALDRFNAAMMTTLPYAESSPAHATRRWSRLTRARDGRRSGRRVATVAVALTLGAAGTAVAADYISTHTGQHASGADVEIGGPGELLRLDGTDLADVTAQVVADIPFPADPARKAVVLAAKDFASVPIDEQGAAPLASTGAVRAAYARLSVCAFADAYGAAPPGSVARTTAAHGLRDLLASSAVRDVDPNPSPAGHAGDQGPTATLFGYLPAVAAAAESGDLAGLKTAVAQTGYCWSSDPARSISHLAQASR